MKEWHIKQNQEVYTLLIDQVTILKGDISDWKTIIDSLQAYFDRSPSEIKLFENETLIAKQDFHLSTISFKEEIKSTNTKDIEKMIHTQFISQLELSPFYKQFIDLWEDLLEEVDFLNSVNEPSPLSFQLEGFKKKIVTDHLKSSHSKNLHSNGLDSLISQIELIEFATKNKKKIIVIVYPEIVLNEKELLGLSLYLQNKRSSSSYFIVTKVHVNGVKNIYHNEKIVNELVLQKIKSYFKEVIPFPFEDEVYEKASHWYIKLVDNFHSETVIFDTSSVDNLKDFLYLYTLFYVTKTPVITDLTTVPAAYRNYIDKLVSGTL